MRYKEQLEVVDAWKVRATASNSCIRNVSPSFRVTMGLTGSDPHPR